MKIVNKYIQAVISGRTEIAERIKYSLILDAVAAVHILHLIVFLFLGRIVLIVNLMIGLAWLSLATYFNHKKKFFVCLGIIYCEGYALGLIISCYIGWNYGFTYYFLALIPVLYHLINSDGSYKVKVKAPAFISILSLLGIIVIRFLTTTYVTYQPLSRIQTNIIYSLNCIICYGLMGMFSVISIIQMKSAQKRLRQQNERLAYLASCDPLTSLLNRRSMMNHLRDAMSLLVNQNKMSCVILCDIDDFKKINDSYGHECGDVILVQIAELLLRCLDTQCKVSRWGGEEILILAPYSLNDCVEVIEKVRKRLEEYTFTYHEQAIHVTMTFGIKQFEKNMMIQELIQYADDNMYRGKQKGKNCVMN